MNAKSQQPLAAFLEVYLPQHVSSQAKKHNQIYTNIYTSLHFPLHFLVHRVKLIKQNSLLNGKVSIPVSLLLC